MMSSDFRVIDLGAVHGRPVSAVVQRDLVHQVASACEEIGFFAVTGHGVPGSVIAGLVAQSYFTLPKVTQMLTSTMKRFFTSWQRHHSVATEHSGSGPMRAVPSRCSGLFSTVREQEMFVAPRRRSEFLTVADIAWKRGGVDPVRPVRDR
jgi:isopenicillin N synthase-like dioxygenase